MESNPVSCAAIMPDPDLSGMVSAPAPTAAGESPEGPSPAGNSAGEANSEMEEMVGGFRMPTSSLNMGIGVKDNWLAAARVQQFEVVRT